MIMLIMTMMTSRLPSFRALVEASPGEEGVRLLVNKAECVTKVGELLEGFSANLAIFTSLVKSLHFLVCDLPR